MVLSADHGFMNVPEFSAARGFDAGRVDPLDVRNAVNAAAEKKFGFPKVATQRMTGGVTLDYAAIDAKGLEREAVETFVARATLEQPGIAYAYTRSQLERGDVPAHRIGLLVQRAWNRQMAVDIVVVPKPFYYFQAKNTTSPNACSHGTPYSYDTNVASAAGRSVGASGTVRRIRGDRRHRADARLPAQCAGAERERGQGAGTGAGRRPLARPLRRADRGRSDC